MIMKMSSQRHAASGPEAGMHGVAGVDGPHSPLRQRERETAHFRLLVRLVAAQRASTGRLLWIKPPWSNTFAALFQSRQSW